MDELKTFNSCMSKERMRYRFFEEKPPLYDYMLKRIDERKNEIKYLDVLSPKQIKSLRDADMALVKSIEK